MIRSVVQFVARGLYGVTSFWLPKSHVFCRYGMYTRLAEMGGRLPARTGSVLSISWSEHLAAILGYVPTEVTAANYPGVNILFLPYPDNTFDLVLSDQVFEHIQGNPEVAMSECLRVLKPGGVMVHTTCFLIPNHGPGDYWRYTPEGLAHLCRSATRVIEASGTGNPLFPLLTGLGFTNVRVPRWRWHPLTWLARYRRPSYDYTVWVAAEK